MTQTLMNRLERLADAIKTLEATPGEHPNNSLIIAGELRQEFDELVKMANASPALFLALETMVQATRTSDVKTWKDAITQAQAVLSRIKVGSDVEAS